jgi:REP element-mobilizing transposase RayT
MNHVHAFMDLEPHMCISDSARDIENNSSNFINKQEYVKVKFG